MPVLKVYEPKEGKEKLWHFRLLLLKTASLFLVAILFCAGGLYLFDESGAPLSERALNATWNAFNTLTTLGDFRDLSVKQKVFLLLGMVLLVMIGVYGISAIPGILSDPQVLQIRASLTSEGGDTPQEHVIIVGFDTLGQRVAQTLQNDGHELVIIDQDDAAAQRASQAGYQVVAGQADRAQTLQEAQIARAKAVLIAIKSGEKMASKLSIALMARALNPNAYILALSHSAAGRNWLSHAGASEVILIDQLVAETSVQAYLRYGEPKQS